jgi:hypothetical protein
MPYDRGPLRSDHSMKNIDDDRSTNAATSASWDVFRWRPRERKEYDRRYYEANRATILAKKRRAA